MTTKKEIYKCSVCGNIVEVLHEGIGTLVCCDKPMIKMSELDEEEGKTEKHRPIIEESDDGIVVRVGSVSHPMDEDHYIEWIEIITSEGSFRKFLNPGDEPIARFRVKTPLSGVSARAYCNLHGLWKN